MKDHVVTQSQEERIGIPAGTIIQVEMFTEDEVRERIGQIPDIGDYAKRFFLSGVLLGKQLHLPE